MYYKAMKEISEKLDNIIHLLEFIKNQHPDIHLIPGSYNAIGEICNCGNHKHGESTNGWCCPVHGICF